MKLGTAHRTPSCTPVLADHSFEVPPGYRLLERIGSGTPDRQDWCARAPGGFRVVLTWLATGEYEAETLGARLFRDLSSATHPNLVTVLAGWQAAGRVILASERAPSSLSDVANGLGREELVEAFLEAAKGLDFLAEHPGFRGHGALGPDSFRLAGGGVKIQFPTPPWWPKSSRSASLYRAPEARAGHTSGTSDQYSLALLYCTLRSGSGSEALRRRKGGAAPHEFTREERLAVARALQTEPSRRWPSSRAFVEALRGGGAVVSCAAGARTAALPDGGHRTPRGLPLARPASGASTRSKPPRAVAMLGAVQPAAVSEDDLGPVGKGRHEGRPLGDESRSGERRPDLAAEARRRGDELLRLGAPLEALGAFDEALGHDPNNAQALHGRGLAHHAAGDLVHALEDLVRAARLRPHDSILLNNRALVRLALGDTEVAVADFRASVRIDPDHAVVHYNLGRALAQSHCLEEAVRAFDEAIRLDPSQTRALTARADALVRLGEPGRALADYEEALKLVPDDATARNNRGLLLLKRGEPDRAVSDFDEAVRLDPSLAVVHYNLGKALSRLGRLREAHEACERALRIDPSFHRAREAISTIKARMHALAEGPRDPKGPNDSESLTLPARGLDSPESPSILTNSVAIDPDPPTECNPLAQWTDWNAKNLVKVG